MYPFPTQKEKSKGKKDQGFTLIELLVVIAIIAILAVVVVLTLNPQQLLEQSRDSNRVASLSTVNTAVAFAKSEGLSLGTPGIAYISIPDPTLTGNQTSTCASLGLPAIASTTYQCVSRANVENDNGTGWIPIAFSSLPGGFSLGALPIDPVNTSSSNEYFVYTTNGSGYELLSNPEAAKNVSSTSFAQGSNLAILTSFPEATCVSNLTATGTAGQNGGFIYLGWTNNVLNDPTLNILIATTINGSYTNVGNTTSVSGSYTYNGTINQTPAPPITIEPSTTYYILLQPSPSTCQSVETTATTNGLHFAAP